MSSLSECTKTEKNRADSVVMDTKRNVLALNSFRDGFRIAAVLLLDFTNGRTNFAGIRRTLYLID